MRDWQCGHGNMALPRAVTAGGQGEIIVDVGLYDAQETVAAVKHGFTVIGFEPMPQNFAQIRELRTRPHTRTAAASRTQRTQRALSVSNQ